MKTKLCIIVALLALLKCAEAGIAPPVGEGVPVPETPGFSLSSVENYTKLASHGESSYYTLVTPAADYDDPIYFLHLVGSRADMGAAYAILAGKQVREAYEYVLKKSGLSLASRIAVEKFVDWQWNDWLSKSLSNAHKQELAAMKEADEHVWKVVTRVLVFANFPSDLPEDMEPILADEYAHRADGDDGVVFEQMWRALGRVGATLGGGTGSERREGHCSMFAVWGSRTENNDLWAMRNLDFGSFGQNHWKSVIVWRPNDGAKSHAAFGYLMVYGVLSGFSPYIAVAEANLEENIETFRGYPWVLRLRHVMEHSTNLLEAATVFNATANTVGYNHMLASQADAAPGSHAAVALETRAFYTASFYDNDVREQTARNPQTGALMGAPLTEALWRTNHPYDPVQIDGYQWYTYHAYQWSQERYFFGAEAFGSYAASNTTIGVIEAINITSIIGDKGEQDAYSCANRAQFNRATNILSTTYHVASNTTYVAFDNGEPGTPQWTPAACNSYVQIDFTDWW
jgi:hypothetical protein